MNKNQSVAKASRKISAFLRQTEYSQCMQIQPRLTEQIKAKYWLHHKPVTDSVWQMFFQCSLVQKYARQELQCSWCRCNFGVVRPGIISLDCSSICERNLKLSCSPCVGVCHAEQSKIESPPNHWLHPTRMKIEASVRRRIMKQRHDAAARWRKCLQIKDVFSYCRIESNMSNIWKLPNWKLEGRACPAVVGWVKNSFCSV